MKAIGF